MSTRILYRTDSASESEIAQHLDKCSGEFFPPLNERVQIGDYAKKIATYATRQEAWSAGELVGLVAVYCNDKNSRKAYITSVSVLRNWTKKGIASVLLANSIERANAQGMRRISLHVSNSNLAAIKLYKKCGFIVVESNETKTKFELDLEHEDRT